MDQQIVVLVVLLAVIGGIGGVVGLFAVVRTISRLFPQRRDPELIRLRMEVDRAERDLLKMFDIAEEAIRLATILEQQAQLLRQQQEAERRVEAAKNELDQRRSRPEAGASRSSTQPPASS